MRLRVLGGGLVGFFLLSGCAIKKKAIVNQAAIEFAQTITASDLEKHLSILASDEYEGRETGKEGQKKAANYIQDHFKLIGLNPGNGESYFQPFPLEVKDPNNVDIQINGKSYQFLTDYYYFATFPDVQVSTEKIAYIKGGIDDGIYSNYSGIDVKEHAVFIDNTIDEGLKLESDWESWRMRLKVAEQKGAVVVFFVMDNFEMHIDRIRDYLSNPKMQLHNKGNRKTGEGIPYFFISKAMACDISNRICNAENEFFEDAAIAVNVYTSETDITSENVLGYLEGSDKKNEILVITAHYDHIGFDNGKIFNGADDDGSGTVTVLELAEAFSKAAAAGKRPRRSLLFMTVSGEEKGLLGSQYYTDHPVYPLENTVADLNIDMVGRIDDFHKGGNYIYLIGADRLSSELHEISERSNNTYTQLELDYTFNKKDDPNRFYYRSDHYNFAKHGIPVIFYFNGTHEDYHKSTDTVEKINFPKMEKIGRLIFHTAWEIANRENRLILDGKLEE